MLNSWLARRSVAHAVSASQPSSPITAPFRLLDYRARLEYAQHLLHALGRAGGGDHHAAFTSRS